MTDHWIQTASGIAFDLLEPKPDQVTLFDIAHALSRIPRFNGHTVLGDTPYSVAQHSLLVESLLPEDAEPTFRLAALLHDAHEAYVGDITSPMKNALSAVQIVISKSSKTIWPRISSAVSDSGTHSESDIISGMFRLLLDPIELKINIAIRKAFGLPDPLPATWSDAIERADLIALYAERDAFMEEPPKPWTARGLPPLPEARSERTNAMLRSAYVAKFAKTMFIDRFYDLHKMRNGL